MLGIIIGVGAVIALVSVGMGVRSNVTSSIASLGSNMLIVSPGSSNRGGVRGAAGSMQTLKYDDAKAIQTKIKNIDYVSPTVSSSYQLVNGNMNWNCSVQGVTPEFLAIRSLEIDYGSFISTNDLDKRNRVCVIGTTVAENLFENQNPVGQTIRIKNQPFKVIGLLKSKGQSSMGQDQDDMVYIPLTTAQERMLGITYVQSINLQVSDSGKMDQVQAEVEQLLRERHHITNGKDDDFHVRNLTSLMETVNQSTSMLTRIKDAFLGSRVILNNGQKGTIAAYPNDYAAGIGGDVHEYHDAVPHRVDGYRHYRWHHRHRSWLCRIKDYFAVWKFYDGDHGIAHYRIVWFLCGDRPLFWHLSSA